VFAVTRTLQKLKKYSELNQRNTCSAYSMQLRLISKSLELTINRALIEIFQTASLDVINESHVTEIVETKLLIAKT